MYRHILETTESHGNMLKPALLVMLMTGLAPLSAQAASAGIAAEPMMIAATTTQNTICNSCGVITRISAAKKKHRNTHVGLVAGAVVGGVVGHNVGHGDSATAAGAVGGAVIGNEIEKRNLKKETKYYRVYVRMQNGSTRTVNVHSKSGLHVNQRVRVQDGNIIVR